MCPNRFLFYLFLFMATVSCALSSADVRTWTDRGGKFQVEATLLDFDGKDVTLKKKEDGKVVTLALEKLSLPDQVYVRKTMDVLGGVKEAEPEKSSPRSDRSTAKKKSEPPQEEETELSYNSFDGSFRGTIPVTRLSNCRQIRTDLVKKTWSIDADPGKTPVFDFTPRPFSIAAGPEHGRGTVRPRKIFFAADDPEKALTALKIEEGRQKNTVAFFADVRNGTVLSRVVWPAELTPLGLSPDGTKALFGQVDEKESFGRMKFLTVADTTQKRLPCIAAFAPFAEKGERGRSSSFGDYFVDACWVDNEHVLVMSIKAVFLLRIKDGSAVWLVESSLNDSITLSPGRKYLVLHLNPLEYGLMEALTGKPIGRITVPSKRKVPTLNFGFSTDGRFLAGFSLSHLYLWDIRTGVDFEPIYCGNMPGIRHPYWMDGDHLLVGDRLIHAWEEIPIWQYRDADPENAFLGNTVFGGYYWNTGKEHLRNHFRISPVKLPHAGIPTLPKMSDEQKFCVRPGVSVRISIDPTIPDSERVRSYVMERILENGLRLDDNASLAFHARMQAEESTEIDYRAWPHLHSKTVAKARYTPYRYSFSFEQDGKTLWTTSFRTGVPSLTMDEARSASVQQIVDEKSKPKPDMFFTFGIPKRIPFDKAGKSDIMPGR